MSVWIFYGLLQHMKVWKRNLGCASKESTFTKIYSSKKFNVKYNLFSKCLKKITGNQDPFLKKFILKISESSNKSTPVAEVRFSKIAINWNFPHLYSIFPPSSICWICFPLDFNDFPKENNIKSYELLH